MRIIFFCENANQVYLSNAVLNSVSFPASADVEFICLDWDTETAKWVSQAVVSIGGLIRAKNLYDAAPEHLKKAVVGAKNKRAFLSDIVFDHFKDSIGRDNLLLVQFNDASQRGEAVARVCRNIGIRRLLIQDGFLNFVSKTDNLAKSDQNYNWGATHPEMISVWGQGMKDALIERHANGSSSIHVTGSIKASMNVPSDVLYQPKSRDKVRVLWADQAILDQNKARKDLWLAEYADIARALSDFDVDLRLHPSTKEKTKAELRCAVEDRLVLDVPARPTLTSEELLSFDVVVTYYSTVFLDCLANNIPCVLFKTKSLDIELPSIDHPLLYYCGEIDLLAATIERAAKTKVEGPASESIRYYLSGNDGAENAAEMISLVVSRFEPAEDLVSSPEISTEVYSNARRLHDRKILVLGGSFGNHIGVGKPIKTFVEYMRSLDLEIEYHLVTNGDSFNLLSKISLASLVIVNSFDVIRAISEVDMLNIKKLCELRSTPIVFYCHETGFTYERLKGEYGGKVQAFVDKVLPGVHSLAVSDRQADWLASLGCRSIRTVYNAVGKGFEPLEERVISEQPIVLMVGTQQKRKGVEIFSHVADAAKKEGLEWRFVWLGAYTKGAKGCYQSKNVEWCGQVSSTEVSDWLRKTSVFFLSSVDDPMPLGVGEALMSQVPCLVYSKTGFADFIEVHQAGEVFRAYEPRAVLKKLKLMMPRLSEYHVEVRKVKDIVGVEAFSKRMIVALGEILIGNSPQYQANHQLASAVALHRVLNKVLSASPKPASNIKKKSKKMRFLDALERTLPTFIVKPGEKILRILKVI